MFPSPRATAPLCDSSWPTISSMAYSSGAAAPRGNMMETATLQLPKTGRSRFSKALPTPPSLPVLPALPSFEFESQLPPLVPEKALPRLQSRPPPDAPLPPIPPPKGLGLERETAMATTAKPLNYPLPPLPPPKFALPPPKRITRRPVAAPVLSPTAAPAPAPAPIPVPVLASPRQLPSPSGSISDLLSAYTNHSDDPTPWSSSTSAAKDITGSEKAYSVVSPSLGTQRSSTNSEARAQPLSASSSDQHAQKREPNGPQALRTDLDEFPPPPPSKDAQRGLPRPQTPTAPQAQVAQTSTSPRMGSPLGNTSPQQEQLWRRRSLKADKNLAVPDLKLVSSHGSTAASAQNSSLSDPASLLSQPLPPPPRPEPETFEPTTTARAPPPRTANAGLPGRNIRPIAPSEQIASQGEVSMGQEASRIKEKLGGGRRQGSRDEARGNGPEVQVSHAAATQSPTASLGTISPLSAQRLPTPEYGTNDVRSPLPDTVVSPLSPASSPGLPGEQKPPISRKALGAPESQLRQAKSTTSLAPGTNPGLSVRSPIGLPTSPAPDRGRSVNQTQFPPPLPSKNEDQRPLAAPPIRQPDLQSPYLAYQPSNPWSQTPTPNHKPISETGSIETVKALPPPPARRPDHHSHPTEQQLPLRETVPNQADTTDNPGAALFPRNWYTPLATDAILDARPLTDRQFRCLTHHRYMTANKQRANPIGCRTCGHKDRNAECYICSACHLNVCSGCSGLLRRFKGDLGMVLKEVGGKAGFGVEA